jgi:hypothetical protein
MSIFSVLNRLVRESNQVAGVEWEVSLARPHVRHGPLEDCSSEVIQKTLSSPSMDLGRTVKTSHYWPTHATKDSLDLDLMWAAN